MRRSLFILALTFICNIVYSQEPQPILLYPQGVPNSNHAALPDYYQAGPDGKPKNLVITNPSIIPYFPAAQKANGTAVIICGGGGYHTLSKIGIVMARKMNENGITAFVLNYRMPSDTLMVNKTIGPLQDIQTAIMLVRGNAKMYHIDPNKIGVMGFSAGGHVASTAGTHFNKPVIDDKERISLRPDFMILAYPVITMDNLANRASKIALLGRNPSQNLIDQYSNEKQVTAQTPPTFLAVAQDDEVVPYQNSVMFYDALIKHKVKAEIHVFPTGGHGLRFPQTTPDNNWFAMSIKWMQSNGFL